MTDYHNDPEDSKADFKETKKLLKNIFLAATAVGAFALSAYLGHMVHEGPSTDKPPEDPAPKVQQVTPSQVKPSL